MGLHKGLYRGPIACYGLVDDWLQFIVLKSPESCFGEIGDEIVLILVATGLQSSRYKADTLGK